MVPGYVLCIAEIRANIPFRQYVPPLSTHSAIQGIGWRCEIIAGYAGKHAERKRVAKTMPVVYRPHPKEVVPIDLVVFEPDTQIVRIGDRAACAEPDMGTGTDL